MKEPTLMDFLKWYNANHKTSDMLADLFMDFLEDWKTSQSTTNDGYDTPALLRFKKKMKENRFPPSHMTKEEAIAQIKRSLQTQTNNKPEGNNK